MNKSSTMDNLRNKKCKPCEGGSKPLDQDNVAYYISLVSGWKVVKGKMIKREFVFNNFNEAMMFVNKVAKIAEEEGHHPDMFIHDWNKVSVSLTTHAIEGLSDNDFILAAKIDSLIS